MHVKQEEKERQKTTSESIFRLTKNSSANKAASELTNKDGHELCDVGKETKGGKALHNEEDVVTSLETFLGLPEGIRPLLDKAEIKDPILDEDEDKRTGLFDVVTGETGPRYPKNDHGALMTSDWKSDFVLFNTEIGVLFEFEFKYGFGPETVETAINQLAGYLYNQLWWFILRLRVGLQESLWICSPFGKEGITKITNQAKVD